MRPQQPQKQTADAIGSRLIRAAQYIRMSTEHQQYSTENQADVIQEYANRRGFVLVKTYADEGKSGLRIEGRKALAQLISDVQNKKADFNAVLVYDISRWGRFQDSDESAYYEYICKRGGVDVCYCAEQFENDGSPASTIIKSVKRAMAGEYSRELSSKVFKGQCNLIQKGFRQGGSPGLALRRMLVDQTGSPKGLLRRGEQKNLQTDRVILVPGPEEERATVARIYELFTREGKRESQIASILNGDGIPSEWERPWTRGMVHQILINEKYIGNNVYNRISFKLKKKRVRNDPSMWVRAESAFDAVVEPQLFYTAQGIILERSRRYSDEEMLTHLKALAAKSPRLSGLVIDESEAMPSSSSYRSRFGSLLRAYRLIGYTPERDYSYVEANRRLRELHPELMTLIISQLEAAGAFIELDRKTDLLLINGEFTASVVLSRCRQTQGGSLRWLIRLDQGLLPDITIAARMDAVNTTPSDFYLLPHNDLSLARLQIAESNAVHIETFRFDTLDEFFHMAARVKITVAA